MTEREFSGPTDKDCPECHKSKWATVMPQVGMSPTDLRCTECGFMVDYRIVLREPYILKVAARPVQLVEHPADEAGP